MSRLEEIKARVEAATEAVKQTEYKYFGDYELDSKQEEAVEVLVKQSADVPYLLAVIESQAKEIEALRVGLKEYCNIRLSGRMTHYWAELQTQYADAIAKARQELK